MRRLKSSQTVCVTSTASLVSNQFSSMTHIKNSTISQQSQQYSKKRAWQRLMRLFGASSLTAPPCNSPIPIRLLHTPKPTQPNSLPQS
mmetsp:Transcript_4515/g.17095  ORF Transcript_4515/g.17095 Transcript_4515/m.17095 type:complete len:88 (-) Transcript_4515:182-445(-)